MQYGIGTLRDNQQIRLCLIWINCLWKKSVGNKALVVTWRDMTWHDVAWRDMTWQDVTWRDMTWHDVAWSGMTWHNVTWRDKTWRDVAWRGVTWHDVTWHDNKVDNKVDNKALIVWPSRVFRATAYKFRAFLSRNECLGNLKNLLNRKVTWIFEVPQTW